MSLRDSLREDLTDSSSANIGEPHALEVVSVDSPNAEGEQHSSLLIIPPVPYSLENAKVLLLPVRDDFRPLVLHSPLPDIHHVFQYAEALEKRLITLGVKRSSVFAIGPGGTVGQALAIIAPSLVRRLILLDATARLSPSLLTRVIDRLERHLPLGLPLHKLGGAFDSRPFLHRIRCPVLVATSVDASAYAVAQAAFMSEKIPNAFSLRLSSRTFEYGSLSVELAGLLRTFLQVPVKRPQKGLGA